jgi:membrane protein DedA with SNARE-associated domain
VPAVHAFLGSFSQNLYLTVFVVAAIDATGIPFPGRLLMVMAGAYASRESDLLLTIALAAAGALAGDHLLYAVGRLGGEKMQSLYCRWTGTGQGCIVKTREYFDRYGVLAIGLGRFVFSLRLVAALLAGSGAMSYWRFLLFDALGAVTWAAALILCGWFLGRRASELLERYASLELLLVVAAAGMLAIGALRLWRRPRPRKAIRPVTT